ncbi:MAG TPA: universal stress protein [Pyrinomonadaceae bacterium]|nr:universal stress protein [Pyrinomonadaceae bacterium]
MRLLIGHDGSSYADAAIEDLKRAGLPERVEALVVTVGEPPVVFPLAGPEIVEPVFAGEKVRSIVDHANRQAAASLLEEKSFAQNAASKLSSCFPSWRVQSEVVTGRPADELIRKAREWEAELIVVGTQGLSALGRLILGSVSQEVVKDAHCSVRVGRSATNADRTGLKVLVGLQLSRSAEQVLRRILQRSWPVGTELRVMTGDGSPSHRWQSDGVFRDIFVGDLRVSAAAVKGDTQDVLLDEARRMEADCIVIGSGLAAIAANAECSVEIVR